MRTIIDVGAHDGTDTANYLAKGYHVVAVEADPLKAEALRVRFKNEIDSRRCHIVNCGVGAEAGTLPFYRSGSDGGSSSFDPEWRDAIDVIDLPVRPLLEVVKEYGKPYYIKVDIEGYDYAALSTLTPDFAPVYVSAEIQGHPELLDLFISLGYGNFKLIMQPYQTSSEQIYDRDYGWRLLRRLCWLVPGLHSLIAALPPHLRPKIEWEYPKAGSGPFAEETEGPWLSEIEVRKKLTRIMDYARKYEDGKAWVDLHAKLG